MGPRTAGLVRVVQGPVRSPQRRLPDATAPGLAFLEGTDSAYKEEEVNVYVIKMKRAEMAESLRVYDILAEGPVEAIDKATSHNREAETITNVPYRVVSLNEKSWGIL